jgi:hypothetical protein
MFFATGVNAIPRVPLALSCQLALSCAPALSCIAAPSKDIVRTMASWPALAGQTCYCGLPRRGCAMEMKRKPDTAFAPKELVP